MRTNYALNKGLDGEYRGGTFPWSPPASRYAAILTASGFRGLMNSQTPTLNAYYAVLANDGIIHLYKCTATSGAFASAQSTLYPGVANESITDGSCTMVEQDSALRAAAGNAAILGEPTGGTAVHYARVAISATPGASAGFSAGGNGAAGAATGASAAALTGSAPKIVLANNADITWPAPNGTGTQDDWAKSPAVWWAVALLDSATPAGSNCLDIAPLAACKNVATGDQAPKVSAGQLTLSAN